MCVLPPPRPPLPRGEHGVDSCASDLTSGCAVPSRSRIRGWATGTTPRAKGGLHLLSTRFIFVLDGFLPFFFFPVFFPFFYASMGNAKKERGCAIDQHLGGQSNRKLCVRWCPPHPGTSRMHPNSLDSHCSSHAGGDGGGVASASSASESELLRDRFFFSFIFSSSLMGSSRSRFASPRRRRRRRRRARGTGSPCPPSLA